MRGGFLSAAVFQTDAIFPWTLAKQLLVFDLAEVIIISCYPVICWKLRSRFRSRVIPADGSLPAAVATVAKWSRRDEDQKTGQVAAAPTNSRKPSTGFRVLTLMTMSIVVCFIPISILYNVDTFVKVRTVLAYEVTYFIFVMEAVLDPLWFVLTIKDLRNALGWIRCGRAAPTAS